MAKRKQSQLNFLDNLLPMATEDRAVQYKYFNGELHVKIGFGEWTPSTQCPKPVYVPAEYQDRMDLSKVACDMPSRGGLQVKSLPKTRRGGDGW